MWAYFEIATIPKVQGLSTILFRSTDITYRSCNHYMLPQITSQLITTQNNFARTPDTSTASSFSYWTF